MKGRKAKLPFEDLDQEFKDLVANLQDDDIRKKMAEVAINEHENQLAKKADQDLESKKEQYKIAGELYKEATKGNKLRIKYCYSILEARGKV